MRTLFSYVVSPYAAKVRAILRYKGLSFEEKLVDPTDRRELKRLTGQVAVPVLVEGERAIHDSTRIAQFLDENHPERPILPADPALRARALFAEDWADEALPRAVQAVRWLIPANAERTVELWRASYPSGIVWDAKLAAAARVVVWGQGRKYGPRPPERPRASAILNRLAETLDVLDGALAETGWLAGPSPTVADFAVWGFLHFLDGLDGWETVKARKRVARLLKTLGEERVEKPEAYDAEDAEQLEARRHREAKRRLPLA